MTKFKWDKTNHNKYTTSGRPAGSYICSVLRYDEYYFSFNFNGRKYEPMFSPSENKRTEKLEEIYESELERVFLYWLLNLKKEVNEPDLWADLQKYRPTGEIPEIRDQEKNKFTYDQVDQLKVSFEKIKIEIISEFKLNEKQEKELGENIDYLVEAAKRQNMRDWRNLCIGTFMGLAMNLAVTPDKINRFWQIINDGFGVVRHFLGV